MGRVGVGGPPWLDVGQAREPLVRAGVSGVEWAQLLTSALVWVAVPGAVGLVRVRRSSVA
ncbi:hypothetical protein [Cryptosporangium sp. NPDC051539]|uniref:hypothetical protein n=1 Tax=Cryptosporangium sp. NPDC051539 TaxID=3363962 RepID=UPI0037985E79